MRGYFRQMVVEPFRAGKAGGNLAAAVDDVKIGRAGHVVEPGYFARIGLAIADLRPGDSLFGDEALNLGRLVVKCNANNREPALLVLPVEFFE